MKDPGKGIKLTAAMRDKLPAKAFGLPAQRKYPMMVLRDGKPVASFTHIAAAKAYAVKGLDQGYLSPAQYQTILTKAINVEAKAKGNRTPNPKRIADLTPKERQELKEYKLREAKQGKKDSAAARKNTRSLIRKLAGG